MRADVRRIILGLALAAAASRPSLLPAPPVNQPVLGVAVDLEASASPAARQAALESVRRTGAVFFVLEVSWSAAEPRPRTYQLEKITRAARVLRQSGATLHLDLPLVTESARDVPSDLSTVAFDDPRLSLRLGHLLEALEPALLDFQTISLGEGADAYFAAHREELHAYRRLFDGAVQFLGKRAPHLLVGVTTAAPTESRAPEVAGALHRRSPALFYVYSALARAEPFTERDPSALEADWTALVKSAAGRPIGFPVVSYSSSPANGSNPEKQAEFVRQLRRFVTRSDRGAVLFVRYVGLRDSPERAKAAEESETERRRRAFLSNRGLQRSDGDPKPAWREWVRAGTPVKR